MELPAWPVKVDPWLQRTVWISGGIVAVNSIINNIISPNHIIISPILMLFLAACYFYLSLKNKNFLVTGSIQYILVTEILICSVCALLNLSKVNASYLFASVLWGLSAAAWFMLSMRSAYMKDKLLWGVIQSQVELQLSQVESLSRQVDSVSKLTINQTQLIKIMERYNSNLPGITQKIEDLVKGIEEAVPPSNNETVNTDTINVASSSTPAP